MATSCAPQGSVEVAGKTIIAEKCNSHWQPCVLTSAGLKLAVTARDDPRKPTTASGGKRLVVCDSVRLRRRQCRRHGMQRILSLTGFLADLVLQSQSLPRLFANLCDPYSLLPLVSRPPCFNKRPNATPPASTRGLYVGWVCALPVELAAAQEMLDEEHEGLEQDGHDTNIYSLGKVGQHNIVIACLPEGQTGTNSTAAVAVQIKSAFTSIRFSLIVGIGGGVPSEEVDMRLGDVVISRPLNVHGGVVQYDSGKATPSGFQRTGSLNTPPTILLNAVANLRANHFRGRSRLSEFLSKLNGLPGFAREAAGLDILFETEYNHEGGATCGKCNKDRLVSREPRVQEVVLHYGTVASGNQVMRDGAERDRVSTELGGVLCFEMEAAGLMNSFPCLVIRGICDYADSHKNKKWQPYAAGTAAACAKEVLSVIPPSEVAKADTVEETIKGAGGVSNKWNNHDSKIGEQVGTKTVQGNQSITL